MTTPQTSQETNGPVVVGVDGSATSLGALRYAVDEAHRAGAPVHAAGTAVALGLELSQVQFFGD